MCCAGIGGVHLHVHSLHRCCVVLHHIGLFNISSYLKEIKMQCCIMLDIACYFKGSKHVEFDFSFLFKGKRTCNAVLMCCLIFPFKKE